MIYTDLGYIEIEDSDLKNLSVLFGGRGLGKTYSVLKHRIVNSLNDPNQKFIWMRDSQEVVKKIAAGNSLASPICQNEPKLPNITIERINGNYCFVADFKGENEQILGYLMALSTFHNARGISYEDVSCIVWDEFIPEEHERLIKEEATAFFNAYESINRNRELEGITPVQAFCFSNSNTLDNALFVKLGIVDKVERMSRTGKTVWTDEKRGLCVILLSDSPISTRKGNTALYRLTAGTDFANMALKNEWAFDETDGTVSRPLTEYRPIVAVGDITIYKHKSNGSFYTSTHRTGSPPAFGGSSTEIARFRRAFSWLWTEYMCRNIEFESRLSEILLTKYLC